MSEEQEWPMALMTMMKVKTMISTATVIQRPIQVKMMKMEMNVKSTPVKQDEQEETMAPAALMASS